MKLGRKFLFRFEEFGMEAGNWRNLICIVVGSMMVGIWQECRKLGKDYLFRLKFLPVAVGPGL